MFVQLVYAVKCPMWHAYVIKSSFPQVNICIHKHAGSFHITLNEVYSVHL